MHLHRHTCWRERKGVINIGEAFLIAMRRREFGIRFFLSEKVDTCFVSWVVRNVIAMNFLNFCITLERIYFCKGSCWFTLRFFLKVKLKIFILVLTVKMILVKTKFFSWVL